MDRVFVAGGAGFIGSHFVDHCIQKGLQVCVYDKLTYAGNLKNLARSASKIQFVEGDICDAKTLVVTLQAFSPDRVINFAAETHVDNSIREPQYFLESNVMGVFHLLTSCRQYWQSLEGEEQEKFRFLHVSTDEVFGPLTSTQGIHNEDSPYKPSSPYAASKAAADHLIGAWVRTYGFPGIITYCTNNFGSRQHSEKLIPTILARSLAFEPIPIYGDGNHIRDWIFVKDHCLGLLAALERGNPGDKFCFSGENSFTNLEMVKKLTDSVLQFRRPTPGQSYQDLVQHVPDRPGHDFRYALNSHRTRDVLALPPPTDFNQAINETVEAFLNAYS